MERKHQRGVGREAIHPGDLMGKPDHDATEVLAHPVIVLELNELCPPILDRMMEAGELPNFAALHARSDVRVTWADESEDLEPWVQWVTLHTGQLQSVHGAEQLDEGYKIEMPRIWDVLDGMGYATMVFGSMNARTDSESVFLTPDPWSSRVQASDPSFQPLHDFVAFNVTEHTNRSARPDVRIVVNFLRFLARRGLLKSFVGDAVRQLVSERMSRQDLRWRRALLLDRLLWSVFEDEYKRRLPDFATFFANSTAFLQHRYWRHMEPEAYEVKPSDEDMASYGDAVSTSYRQMDELVGRAMKLAGPNGRIVFATGLSQEANLRYEHIGGKFVYRPRSFEGLTKAAGGPDGVSFEPVMTHQAWASCRNEADAIAFEAAMTGLRAGERKVMECRREGSRVFFCCDLISQVEDGMMLITQAGESIEFDKLFASVGQVNNSQHHPDGALWIERSDAKCVVHRGKTPLARGFELILDMFNRPSERRAA